MERTENGLFLKVFVVVTFLAMIVVNALANILPINGITTGAVSDNFLNLFAPAGITFSIWGLIYLLLAWHTLFQLGYFRDKEKKTNVLLLRKTAVAFSVSSIINIVWIFSWHYMLIPLSMVLMVCLLLCLIYIVTGISAQSLSPREKIFLRLPFSVYFGWITVATIANAVTLLVSIGWQGFGLSESVWTVLMLLAGTLIGTATLVRFKDIAYGLVLVWAYAGILIKHTAAAGFSSEYPDVIIILIICIVIFAGALICSFMREKRQQIAP